MEIEFPKFPFIWDYMDMYNIPEYKVNKLILEDYDDNIIFLLSKFKNFEIYESKQYLYSKGLTEQDIQQMIIEDSAQEVDLIHV